MRIRYLQVASALATCAVIATVTLNVTSAQDAEQLTEREDLERIKKLAVNAYLTTPVDDLPMSNATDLLRTIRAWVNQDTDTLWEVMCKEEKEVLGSKERYEEFLHTFEDEFAVKPTLYWAYQVNKHPQQPPEGITVIGARGLAYDSHNGLISKAPWHTTEQHSILEIHVSQLIEYTWPTSWADQATSGGMRALQVDQLAFPQNEMARAFVPVYQHRIERLKAHVNQLEAFGVTLRNMCDADSGSYRDSIAHSEKIVSTLLGEQYDD